MVTPLTLPACSLCTKQKKGWMFCENFVRRLEGSPISDLVRSYATAEKTNQTNARQGQAGCMLTFSAFVSLPGVLGWLSSFGGVRFSELGIIFRFGACSETSAVDTSHETDTWHALSTHETNNPYSHEHNPKRCGPLCTVAIAPKCYFFFK